MFTDVSVNRVIIVICLPAQFTTVKPQIIFLTTYKLHVAVDEARHRSQ
jgi:hypothetical protein